MLSDEIQFSLLEYLDGSLPAEKLAAIEQLLASDGEAAEFVREQRSLDALMRTAPLPMINWNALSKQISSAVYEEVLPRHSWQIHWRWIGAAAAMAASVLIVGGVVLHHRGSVQNVVHVIPVVQPAEVASAIVIGPAAETANGASADVQVGPPVMMDNLPESVDPADGLVDRPSHISITAAVR